MSILTQNQVKPVAIYTTLEDVVKSALIGSYDDSGIAYERFEHFAWRGWKEELVPDVIRTTKHVLLDVGCSTKTVVLPKDYIDYVVIGVVDANRIIHPLSRNPFMLPYDIDTSNTCTCQSGVTAMEITEPVNIVTTTQVCDYEINVQQVCNGCTYELIYDTPPVFPITNVYYYINGGYNQVGVLNNKAALDALMVSLNFTIQGDYDYISPSTCNIYTTFVFTDADFAVNTNTFFRFDCNDSAPITFPYVINSYIQNGEEITVNLTIANQGDLDTFFTGLGFTKNSNTDYSISAIADSYTALYFTQNDIVNGINFSSFRCVTTQHEEIQNQTRIVNVCNLPQDQCTCAVTTNPTCPPNYSCYPCYWNGCNESEYPYASNVWGKYNIFAESGLIQLDQTFQTTTFPKIYLQYYSDGLSQNGNYYIHVFAKPALISYIHWQAIENKRNIAQWEKQRKKEQWIADRNKCKRRLSRVDLQTLYDSIRSLPII